MTTTPPDFGDTVLDDDDLIQKAESAANSRKFTSLFESGWESRAVRRAYETRRCAELALVAHLMWWSRHDRDQVDRLFRRSALYREPYDDYPAYMRSLTRAASDLLGSHCYDPNYSAADPEGPEADDA